LKNQTTTLNEIFNYTVPSDTFIDLDGHALTYTAKTKDLSALPSWLTFDSAQRHFSGTPTSVKAYLISVTANDGFDSVTDSFNIVVEKSRAQKSLELTQGILGGLLLTCAITGATVSAGALLILIVSITICRKKLKTKEYRQRLSSTFTDIELETGDLQDQHNEQEPGINKKKEILTSLMDQVPTQLTRNSPQSK